MQTVQSRDPAEIFPKVLHSVGGRAMMSGVLHIAGAKADLTRGRVVSSDGAVTDLRPKTAALLRALAARAGAICSKDDLLEQVWPGVYIDEDGLVQCIGELRRALGPDKSAIRTYPKRGYALELPNAQAGPGPDKPRRRKAWSILAVVALLAAAGVTVAAVARREPLAPAEVAFNGPTVAVLPFATLSTSEPSERLARALTEDVISDLAQNAWLFVFADATTRELESPGVSSARALGALYAITGTIQVESAVAQIRVGLVDAATGRQLWTKTWDGETNDLLALQRQASEAIVGELASAWNGPIARADKARARGRGVEDLAAYQLYMRAGERMESYTAAGLAEAEQLLKRAVALEPDFGEAWAKLSLVSYNRLSPEMTEPETQALLDQGHAAALEGFRVAPDRPNVLGQAANVVRWTDPVKAEGMIRRAAELAPNNADILAYLAFRAAHFPALAREAEGWIERAYRLNPTHPDWYDLNWAVVLMVLGRYKEAAEAYARGPDNLEVHAGRVAALALSGNTPAAQSALAQVREASPHFSSAWFADAAGLHPDVAAIYARGFALADSGEDVVGGGGR